MLAMGNLAISYISLLTEVLCTLKLVSLGFDVIRQRAIAGMFEDRRRA